MVRHIAASVRADNFDASLFVFRLGQQEVLVVEAGTQGHDGIMFHEEQGVRPTVDDLFGDALLGFPCRDISHMPEVD
jgi:hypothetical protein